MRLLRLKRSRTHHQRQRHKNKETDDPASSTTRPLFSRKHRYDLKETTKIQLIDVNIVAAMGPPGGARNPVTPRFMRHFNIMATLEFSDETMSKIFLTLMNMSMRQNEFPSDVMGVASQVVAGTLSVSGLLCWRARDVIFKQVVYDF